MEKADPDLLCIKGDFCGNYWKNSALYFAVEKGNTEIVELLLSCDDIDVNIMNKHMCDRNDSFVEWWMNNPYSFPIQNHIVFNYI